MPLNGLTIVLAILLVPPDGAAYVGYLVASTIDLRRNGVLLTSARSPALARLIAAETLAEPLFRARANSFEISFLSFDGEAAREVRDKPCNDARNYRNVELTGTAFRVRYVESFNAVCGSGMTVGASSRFEIANCSASDSWWAVTRGPSASAGLRRTCGCTTTTSVVPSSILSSMA